jgi:NAD(P)-dependent dehydrogenase (short-subunit alcohol dehydrogenase family)
MGWTADDIPDQTGRVAVVTGANSGLGLETSRELARKGATVFMCARNLAKAEVAETDIRESVPAADLRIIELDLASLDSVSTAAAAISDDAPVIDILVNNAGVMGIPRKLTADGFEMQFGTNHLGHFAFTAQLMPALLRSNAARIVTVTSTGRLFDAKVEPDDLTMESKYDPWKAYGRSKRANFHFAVELNNRLVAAGSSARSIVSHPGYSNTNLQATSAAETPGGASQRFFHEMVQRVGMDASRGVLPQLRAVTDPGVTGGELFTPQWVNFGAPVRRGYLSSSAKQEDLDRLWTLSEHETGIDFDVAAMVEESDQP